VGVKGLNVSERHRSKVRQTSDRSSYSAARSIDSANPSIKRNIIYMASDRENNYTNVSLQGICYRAAKHRSAAREWIIVKFPTE